MTVRFASSKSANVDGHILAISGLPQKPSPDVLDNARPRWTEHSRKCPKKAQRPTGNGSVPRGRLSRAMLMFGAGLFQFHPLTT